MGYFSWCSSDEHKRIIIGRTENILLVGPDGRRWLESDSYGGYGEFDGVDIYDYIAELNGLSGRDEAIQLVYQYDSWEDAELDGTRLPRLLTDPDNFDRDCMAFPPPAPDPGQGFPDWRG